MRIVQVTGSAAWAGGERQLLDLISGLDKARFELRVILPEPGPLRERLEGLGVQVRVVHLRPLGSLRPARELATLLRAWGADIVQSHGARSNFYARVACGRLGLPHVATVHNSLFDYPVSVHSMVKPGTSLASRSRFGRGKHLQYRQKI